jgi:hypothetical protein
VLVTKDPDSFVSNKIKSATNRIAFSSMLGSKDEEMAVSNLAGIKKVDFVEEAAFFGFERFEIQRFARHCLNKFVIIEKEER